MFPTDLLLSHEWTRVLLSRKPSGFGELQCIRALRGASYPPPLQKRGCGRRLLHSITFPWIIKNQNFRKSTLQHWGKKIKPWSWEKGNKFLLSISKQQATICARHCVQLRCGAEGATEAVMLWEGPFALLWAGWCAAFNVNSHVFQYNTCDIKQGKIKASSSKRSNIFKSLYL